MSTSTPPAKRWMVSHPEVTLDETVEVPTAGETRRIAWHRWYGRPPRSELEELLYAALSVEEMKERAP